MSSSDREEEIDLSDVERKGEEERISLVRETVSSIDQLPQNTSVSGAEDADVITYINIIIIMPLTRNLWREV